VGYSGGDSISRTELTERSKEPGSRKTVGVIIFLGPSPRCFRSRVQRTLRLSQVYQTRANAAGELEPPSRPSSKHAPSHLKISSSEARNPRSLEFL
jgi:hypothetical protein